MRFKLSIAAAMFTGVVLALSASTAQADDHWDRRWDHRHYERWHHEHYVRERPVIIHERGPVFVHERGPVFVERERPVYVAPPVVYPMAPQPSGLNLNFNIPLN
jgi:hypothetical protein